jgi:hypothetical protein
MRVKIAQLQFIHKKLRKIIAFLEATGLEFTITSLYRPNDPGVHGTIPLRAIDLRMRDKSIGKVIEKKINETWEYDYIRPDKQCAVLHGKGSNLHLHIQAHNNTKEK